MGVKNLNVYLDNSATTKPCEKSVKKALEMMNEKFGNPSSLHMCGFTAKKEIDSARHTLSSFLGCEDKEVFFTPSGTVANNTAIFGTANAKRREGKKVVTTLLEHPSVLKCFENLNEQGFDVVFLKPNINGKIDIDDVTLTQKYIVGLEKLTETQILAADTTKDGLINIDDVTTIQKYIANIINEF